MSPESAEHPREAKKVTGSFKPSIIFLLMNMGFVVPARGFSLKSCRISRGTAICTNGHLKAVPPDIPPTVIGIDLTTNCISTIRATDFMDLPKLIKLDLKNNKIKEMNGGAFAHLNSLKILNLNNNKLSTLEDDVFAGLSQLTELRIASNYIKNVKFTAFQSTTSLKFLDLSSNKLQQVDVILQHLPHLQELYVDTNQLPSFQSWQVSNSSLGLRYLGLSQNPMRVFNVTADVFPNLKWLRLGKSSGKRPMKFEVRDRTFLRNVSSLDISSLLMALDDMKTLLESLNSSLSSLKMNGMRLNLAELIDISCSIPTLSKLQIRKNNLISIGSDLFRLCMNLVELDIRDSGVIKISNDAFKSLRNLKTLNLSLNNLLSVPAATRNLPMLRELDLSTCKINTLQCDDFANHTNLTQLNLYQNSIEHLKNCLFEDLQQLRVLKLQTNQISTLNDAFKKHLPKLQILQLNGNKITSIKKEEFRGLITLQNLSLHSNTIKTLNKHCFVGLTNLINLNLQVNKITAEQLQQGVFNVLINLRSLDLSKNMIQYKMMSPLSSPPFSELSRLEVLSVRGQGHRGWSYLPLNFLQGLSSLLSFNSRNIRLKSLHEDMFTFTPRLEHLDINANTLFYLSPGLFTPVWNLKSLYLSRNYLKSLDFFVHANLTKLEFLQARMNQYSVFRAEVINSLPALVYVDITGNSFTCDCDNEWFIQWVMNDTQTQVSDAYNFGCNYPPSLKGKMLLDFNIQSCSLDTGFICFVITTCATLCLMVVSSVYHFMRWQLVYAYYIFLAWLADTKHKNRGGPHQYDAFISYNVHDEPWVIEELLPKLEGEQGWRLCLHHRDFEPGKSVIDNITDAIYGSRKTICVISRRYLESEWCSREIQAAGFRLFDENKDVLILVFLEEIPASKLSPYHRMRKLLKKQTYLSWTRAGEHAGLFWEKLRQALQTGHELDEDRLYVNMQDTQ